MIIYLSRNMSKINRRKLDKQIFFSIQSDNLQLVAIRFQNGFFIAICENERLKLGTTAISLPNIFDNENIEKNTSGKDGFLPGKERLISATVIGSRNELFAKALAEKATRKINTIVYLSIFFKENNQELFTEAISLIDDFIKEIE